MHRTNRRIEMERRMRKMVKEKPICVVEICKGYCCENISRIVKINLEKIGLQFESIGEDRFRCLSHDKETGLCKEYDNRRWYCKTFFCPSAEEGFMRNAIKHIPNATTNKPLNNLLENEKKEVMRLIVNKEGKPDVMFIEENSKGEKNLSIEAKPLKDSLKRDE